MYLGVGQTKTTLELTNLFANRVQISKHFFLVVGGDVVREPAIW